MRWAAVSLAVALTIWTFGEAVAQKRVALVIGNGGYINQTRLDNPGRDARLIGATLQKIGFELVGGGPLVNLDKVTTDKMVDVFATMSQGADIALFYFSGHGIQVSGTNYLLPVDLGSVSNSNIEFRTLNANLVNAAMNSSRARLKIMLLDACRTNPFASSKSLTGGLAQMLAPAGTVIGFATQPNSNAEDGPTGGNSPYAKALATYMNVQGLELFRMLNEVGLAVMDATKNNQQPWLSASPIMGTAYLNPGDIKLPSAPPTSPPIVGHGGDPGSALNLFQQAYKQLDHNEYARARVTLTDAIQADQTFAPAYSYRGFARYLEGLTRNPEDALKAYRDSFVDFDKAIELDQRYAAARRHRGNTILATYRALRALGKPTNEILDRAIDDLKAAVALDQTSKINANALGEAYLLKGEYRVAIDNFNKAIERDRSYAAPYSGICFAHRALGDIVAARRYAQLAASHDSDLVSKPCLTAAMSGSDAFRVAPSPSSHSVSARQ